MGPHPEEIAKWVGRYNLKRIINAPAGGGADHDWLVESGAKEVLDVDIGGQSKVKGDLCEWRPDEGYDAVYINCFFCTTNLSTKGDHKTAASNVASWPVRYIVVCDTPGFEWARVFEESGWVLLERCPFLPHGTTRLEIWGRAKK